MASLGTKVLLPHDVETVWNTLFNFEEYKSWRTDLKELTVVSVLEFIEHTKDGYDTTYKITQIEERERLEFDIDNMNLKGHWVIQFIPKGKATKFTLQQKVNAKKLYMQPFVSSYLKSQQLLYMSDLKKQLS